MIAFRKRDLPAQVMYPGRHFVFYGEAADRARLQGTTRCPNALPFHRPVASALPARLPAKGDIPRYAAPEKGSRKRIHAPREHVAENRSFFFGLAPTVPTVSTARNVFRPYRLTPAIRSMMTSRTSRVLPALQRFSASSLAVKSLQFGDFTFTMLSITCS